MDLIAILRLTIWLWFNYRCATGSVKVTPYRKEKAGWNFRQIMQLTLEFPTCAIAVHLWATGKQANVTTYLVTATKLARRSMFHMWRIVVADHVCCTDTDTIPEDWGMKGNNMTTDFCSWTIYQSTDILLQLDSKAEDGYACIVLKLYRTCCRSDWILHTVPTTPPKQQLLHTDIGDSHRRQFHCLRYQGTRCNHFNK